MHLSYWHTQVPMIPLAALVAEKLWDRFGLEVRHAGAALGSPETIQGVLSSAGYVDIQVGSHFVRLHASITQVWTGKAVKTTARSFS